MNKNNEYKALKKEIEQTPPRLDYTYNRACAKRDSKKRHPLLKKIMIPISSVVSALAMFAMLINLFPSVAYAAGRIPLVSDFAEFVAVSTSLKAAVDNQYVQPIDKEQTANDITARIEYAIVDQKQLNVFYTLRSDSITNLQATPKILDSSGNTFEGYAMLSDKMHNDDNKLRMFTVDFFETNMPSEFILQLDVYSGKEHVGITNANEDAFSTEKQTGRDIISDMKFDISVDPYYTAQGKKLDVDTVIDIDGQKLTLVSAEIYPTHMRFNFDDFENNTAWLRSLEFFVENERGERFEGITDGISATGKAGSPMMATHRLESSFFSESEHLTLHITGATWLSKDMEKVHVDLANCTAEAIPDGFQLQHTEKHTNGWVIDFTGPEFSKDKYHDLFISYYDKNGNEYYFDRSSTSAREGECPEVTLWLSGYTKDEVWLRPSFSHTETLDEPIEIKIK